MQTSEYKIMVLGHTGLGKTSFCRKLIDNNNNYLNIAPTLGVDVSPCDYYVNHRKVRLNLWDCSGNENYKGLGNQYYLNSSGAIIFQDKYNKYRNYIQQLLNSCGNIPYVLIEYNMEENIQKYMYKINQLVNLL